MKHLTDEDLVLVYYDERDAPIDAPVHLRECAECAERLEAIRRTLDACSECAPEPPRIGYEQRLWRKVEAGMEPRSRWNWLWPRWVGVAAATAAMVTLAFVAGRFSAKQITSPAPVALAALSPEAQARVLAISVADHLDRAEILLTNAANGIAPDRDRAADLVNEGRLLRSALAKSGPTATLDLIDDVERVLTEAAHQPEHPSTEEVRAMAERIERGSLIFRIRIIQTNLRRREQQS
jgi:hypothetical protein